MTTGLTDTSMRRFVLREATTFAGLSIVLVEKVKKQTMSTFLLSLEGRCLARNLHKNFGAGAQTDVSAQVL